MHIICARQPFPDSWVSSLFLAGPTPRDPGTPSWRPEALRLLGAAGYEGTVFVPEAADGAWGSGPDAYIAQVDWERRGLELADVILFWVPRDMSNMAGLTTNVEFGLYVKSGKVVFGAPEWAVSVKYLEKLVMDETGSPRHHTLEATVNAALERVGTPPARSGGECAVPLHIWTLPSFQQWYGAQVAAGNRLDDARMLWLFQPKGGRVFSWALWVKVWISSEERHSEREFVLSRPDISTVVLYAAPIMDSWTRNMEIRNPGSTAMGRALDTEIVLIWEFRSAARNEGGLVHELPGGSSQIDQDPRLIAADEVHEETGLIIEAARLRPVGDRQLAATFSAHHAQVFMVELTQGELMQAKALAASGEPHGVVEDSERTYVKVLTFQELLRDPNVDWTTVGMVAQALLAI